MEYKVPSSRIVPCGVIAGVGYDRLAVDHKIIFKHLNKLVCKRSIKLVCKVLNKSVDEYSNYDECIKFIPEYP